MKRARVVVIGCVAAFVAVLVIPFAALVLLVRSQGVAKIVSTDCMMPTIRPRDCVASVQSYSLADVTPTRGDLVYFTEASTNRSGRIKRLIGLPGDRARLVDGRLYVNERMLTRSSRGASAQPAEPTGVVMIEHLPEFSYPILADPDAELADGEVVLEEGQYLVMGDNRASWRPECGWETIPADQVAGKIVHLIRDCQGRIRDGDPFVLSSLSLGLAVRDSARYFSIAARGHRVDNMTMPVRVPEDWQVEPAPR